MKNKDIEKIALEYSQKKYCSSENEMRRYMIAQIHACKDGFIEGAKWRIDTVWHDDIKTGRIGKAILVQFTNGLYNVFEDVLDLAGIEDKVKRFAYIDDLMPED